MNNNWRNSWKVYSIGLFVVWAIILTLVLWLDSSSVQKDVWLVFYGYFVGWLSATVKVNLMNRSQPKG